MRITDLLENEDFDKEKKFVKKNGETTELNFDLAEDLSFYMNHDDDLYRRHVYPAVVKCKDRIKNKQTTNPSVFASAVKECYKEYVTKYPMRELPEDITDRQCLQVCKRLHDDLQKHHSEGKYKD